MDRPLENEQFLFHLEEYRNLRAEIISNDRAKFQIEIFGIASVGLLYAFLSQQLSLLTDFGIGLIWWLPTLSIVLTYVWSQSYVKKNIEIGKYLTEVESRFSVTELGWELLNQQKRAAQKLGTISFGKKIVFLLLFFVSFLLAANFTIPLEIN